MLVGLGKAVATACIVGQRAETGIFVVDGLWDGILEPGCMQSSTMWHGNKVVEAKNLVATGGAGGSPPKAHQQIPPQSHGGPAALHATQDSGGPRNRTLVTAPPEETHVN